MPRSLVAMMVGFVVCGTVSAQAEGDKSPVKVLWEQGADRYHGADALGALLYWKEAVRIDPGNAPIQEKIDRVKPELQTYAVLDAVDGNHVVISLDGRDETVRLRGLDITGALPPTASPLEISQAATAATRRLLQGKSAYLSRDILGGRRGPDGLRRGSIVTAPDLAWANEELVREGLARIDSRDGFPAGELLWRAQAQAKAAKAGLWKGFRPLPDEADVRPSYRVDGRLMVPLRPLAEWLNAKLTVHDDGRFVIANREFAVVCYLADVEGEINGRRKKLDKPIILPGSVVYVPVHLIAAAAKAEAVSLPTGELFFKYHDEWTLLP